MNDLIGQHAIITGGGSGIGLACARTFLRDGASVTLLGRTQSTLEQAITTLNDDLPARSGEVRCSVADITDEQALADAIANAHRRLPITLAVANAGTGAASPFLQTTSEQWDQVIQTNLNGTFYTLKHAGQAIAESGGGALCAISSIAGLRTHKFMSAYCTSKAAVDMLVRNAADELGALNVRVNSVCPGLVETDLSQGLTQNKHMREDYLACMPLSRTGMVQDIAQAVRYLCGPEASWVTGVTLPVDGGHHLRRRPNLERLSD